MNKEKDIFNRKNKKCADSLYKIPENYFKELNSELEIRISNLESKNTHSQSRIMNRFYLICKRIYILMHRIQKKQELYSNPNQILKSTNLKTKTI